jgi:hypothetical protein
MGGLSAPVVEAVMINTQGNQGLSFVSPVGLSKPVLSLHIKGILLSGKLSSLVLHYKNFGIGSSVMGIIVGYDACLNEYFESQS